MNMTATVNVFDDIDVSAVAAQMNSERKAYLTAPTDKTAKNVYICQVTGIEQGVSTKGNKFYSIKATVLNAEGSDPLTATGTEATISFTDKKKFDWQEDSELEREFIENTISWAMAALNVPAKQITNAILADLATGKATGLKFKVIAGYRVTPKSKKTLYSTEYRPV